MTSNFPDFSKYGYQIIRELGHNNIGGRVTYLGQRGTVFVVIKQFQFTQMGASWGEYEAYEQEITLLRRLQHPGIPRYLDAFQTPDGFCMVQEYIQGESLATPRSWTPQQIKHVAVAILKILVYLQSQKPSVIHRDIKPENILVDDKMNGYLVDFGFARMGGGEIAASSVVKGTMGFMPTEQLFNQQLTEASDLYGLGATLICLLTGTKSVEIGNLIDADYRIHFRHLVPPLKRGWMNWLEKMTEPRISERYQTAAEALAALESIDVDRLPKVRISQENLKFTPLEFREKVTQTLTLSNPIPGTLLAGEWEVAPHPSDPPHTPYDHAWISFIPRKFEGNKIECKITVNPSKLLAGKVYRREILLHTNSSPETYRISLKVLTAPLPKNSIIRCLVRLILFCGSCYLGWLFPQNTVSILLLPTLMAIAIALDKITWAESQGLKVKIFPTVVCTLLGQIFGFILLVFWLKGPAIGIFVGGIIGAFVMPFDFPKFQNIWWQVCFLECLIFGSLFFYYSRFFSPHRILFERYIELFYYIIFMILILLMLLFIFLGFSFVISCLFSYLINTVKIKREAVNASLLTAGFGMSLGGIVLSLLTLHQNFKLDISQIVWPGIVAIAPPSLISLIFGFTVIYPFFKRIIKIAQYRRSIPRLIQP